MQSPKATTAALLERDGKILLTKRAIQPFQGSWCIPGGHIEIGEPIQEAIKREVKEETGLDFEPRFFGFYDEIFPDINWHAVVLIFQGTPTGEVRPDHEVTEWKWVSPRELKKFRPLAFVDDRILKDWVTFQKMKARLGIGFEELKGNQGNKPLKGPLKAAGGIRA